VAERAWTMEPTNAAAAATALQWAAAARPPEL